MVTSCVVRVEGERVTLAVNQTAKTTSFLHPLISKRAGPGCRLNQDPRECFERNCVSGCSICCGNICYCDPDCSNDHILYCNCNRDNCLNLCPIAGACDVYDYSGCAGSKTGYCNDYFSANGYGCCAIEARFAAADCGYCSIFAGCPSGCRYCCPATAANDTNPAADAAANAIINSKVEVLPPRIIDLFAASNDAAAGGDDGDNLNAAATLAGYPACLLTAALTAYIGRK
ncbi:unnamed protein product [Adineta steineri]|uniref:Uncharacterized protein n=1 Tax=Adineta steineri TaxID=433720 RepID=A0A813QXW7_9BILA|nr:unnamed protein product [Adineta steineri]